LIPRCTLPLLLLGCLAACGAEPPPPGEPLPPRPIRTTYRAVAGISMGGIGSAALAAARPERFDAVAPLGGPLDAAMLLRTLDRFHLGGFCSLAQLEALMAQGPEKLNDPSALAGCQPEPERIAWEHRQDFNRWVFTTSGGSFDRSSYLDIFKDLTLAYGNLLSENPASPFAPPGVDPERLRRPPADFCQKPVRVQGLHNAEYNPEGAYDAVTFCDGEPRLWFCKGDQALVDFCADPQNKAAPLNTAQEEAYAAAFCQGRGGAGLLNKNEHPLRVLEHSGRVDPCRLGTRPMLMALAVDLNGNGRRDYGEPVINNGAERYRDVGADGCADPYEDGQGGCTATADPAAQDPNGDNYDAITHPLGTERNWIWDPGEPFDDFGLDGVPGTSDFGEGNGSFDQSAGRRALFERDLRTRYRALSEEGRARLDLLVDGGIRDLFNFGLSARQLFGLVMHHQGERAALFRDHLDLPGMVDPRTGNFDPWGKRWSALPPSLAVLYGKEAPTDQDRIDGEGDHVGSPTQAVNRVYTLFNWAGARWPSLPRPVTRFGGAPYDERERVTSYDSALLGAPWEFGVFLPPGYDLPENAEVRYPVLYMLHGYGMEPRGFLGTALVADSYMLGDKGKLQPMIIVYPSGRCCYRHRDTGARDCRETDEAGASIGSRPGFERECARGTFYVNRKGFTHDDAVPYGDAFFELMDEVDRRYRTLGPAELEAR
jgi:hypothetical protein